VRVVVKYRPDKTGPRKNRVGCELHFPAQPSKEILRLLGRRKDGGAGFRLARSKPIRWYAFVTFDRERVIQKLREMGDSIPGDPNPKKTVKKRRRAEA